MVFIVLFLIFLTLCIALYSRWNYGVLERMGVPVVKPSFLFGSIPDCHSTVIHEEDIKHFKKCGPIYGVYEGRTPTLYICDPDVIKAVTVRHFYAFRNRRVKDYGNRYFNEVIDLLPYETSKVLRFNLMSAFSPSNLNSMLPEMERCTKDFLERLDFNSEISPNKSVIDIRREASGYAVCVTALNMFNMSVLNPWEDANQWKTLAEKLIEHSAEPGVLYSISLTFPILAQYAPSYGTSSVEKIKTIVDTAIKRARSENCKTLRTDFITRMISLLDKVGTGEFKKLGINETTVYSQAIVLFAVSYEGFSSNLALLAYFLALNDEPRKKLQSELDLHFQTQGTSCQVPKLPYLTACIQETMRLAPLPRRIERICVQNCEINGMKIKKGMNIVVPLYAANRNPAYIDDPCAFKPERFLKPNLQDMNKYCATLFGHGPRNCAGQRYALDVLKFIAARMFHKFEFLKCLDTKLQFKPGRMFIVQFEPIYLQVVKRP